ncbi:MAG: hypothetical protein JWO13_1675 [Acidobacteriales bacterium]|nr:hypothetical protein [Terriglobales bacterium]
MGWYLRKSVGFGPLRVNLSKSGLGYSFGVRGARIGSGPKGTYVRIGRGGLYYQQYLTPKSMGKVQERNQVLPPPDHELSEIVRTADASELHDSSAEQLIEELQTKQNKSRVAIWLAALFSILVLWSLAAGAPLWFLTVLVFSATATCIWGNKLDYDRKSVHLN